jgi:hypothetical protein
MVSNEYIGVFFFIFFVSGFCKDVLGILAGRLQQWWWKEGKWWCGDRVPPGKVAMVVDFCSGWNKDVVAESLEVVEITVCPCM